MAAPDKSSQRALEALMAAVIKSEFVDRLEAAGRIKMILTVLAARGIEAPAEIRDKLLGCTDIEQLNAWGRRAATAESIDEVFGGANRTS
jgi:hypothetical protein